MLKWLDEDESFQKQIEVANEAWADLFWELAGLMKIEKILRWVIKLLRR